MLLCAVGESLPPRRRFVRQTNRRKSSSRDLRFFRLSGFPPIPGQKATGAEQGLVAALVAADKLASTDTVEIAEDDEGDEEEKEVSRHLYMATLLFSVFARTMLTSLCLCVKSKPAAPEEPKKLNVPRAGQGRRRTPSASPDRSTAREGLSPTGQSGSVRPQLPL